MGILCQARHTQKLDRLTGLKSEGRSDTKNGDEQYEGDQASWWRTVFLIVDGAHDEEEEDRSDELWTDVRKNRSKRRQAWLPRRRNMTLKSYSRPETSMSKYGGPLNARRRRTA